jgi:DNA processing protein
VGALSDAGRLDWLRLARTESVGPVLFARLIARYGSAGKALEALPGLAARGGRADALSMPPVNAVRAELEAGEALGARLLAACEDDFPPLLAALDPAPPVIWALGRVELLGRPAVAVVGARNASAAGQRFARQIAADLGRAGQVVVSGLARGVDGAAHEGALKTGTIAVLAGGVDDVYPPEHAGLHERIAREGCIVSERRVGHRAKAQDFPRRNRLISGLAQAVVVVEAELRSGSLITARLAAEQGREVLAVPGSPLEPRARGTNDLIRQGAALCEGAEDVLRVLERPPLVGPLPARPEAADEDEPDDGLRRRIEALLSPTPIPRDELVRLTGAPAAAVNGALMELALAGRAELQPGGLAAAAAG